MRQRGIVRNSHHECYDAYRGERERFEQGVTNSYTLAALERLRARV